MTRRLLVLYATLLACGAARAVAAPIDITVSLNPGQSGPVYAWSLMLRVDPGYDVGSVYVLTRGLDSFSANTANTGISVLDSAYSIDWFQDGRNLLVLNNPPNLVPMSSPGVAVLLGTFFGPNRTSPPVALYDCEVECGGTAWTVANYRAYPRAAVALHVVPEPGLLALIGAALAMAGVLRLSVRAQSLG